MRFFEFAPNGFDGFEDDDRVPMHFIIEKDNYNRRSKWKKSRDADGVILFTTKQQAIQAAEKFNKLDPNREFAYGGTQLVHVDDDDEQLDEFAPASNPGGGNYLKALASAWLNGTFNTGNLHKGIKSQEDVERILERGIHCGDGKVRKYSIGYNANFDGVEIQSDDHYEYSDYDDAGNDIDSRTGKPWGPYDVVSFHSNELDESQLNELSFLGSQCTKDCSGHRAGYEWSQRKGGTDAASWSPSFNKGAWLHNNGF